MNHFLDHVKSHFSEVTAKVNTENALAIHDVIHENAQLFIRTKLFRFVVLPLGSIWLFNKLFPQVYQRWFSNFLNNMDAKFSKDERVTQVKRELFSCIKPGDLVVEIGAGTGTNFQHLPDGCTVICIEPKLTFQGYIDGNIKKRGEHLKEVTFIEGTAENLSEKVNLNSVDAVIATQVMCSVPSIKVAAEQAYKVLKPGGSFLCLEHVLAEEGNYDVRAFQHVITPVTSTVMDGCHWNRQPWVDISKVFTNVSWKRLIDERAARFHPRHTLASVKATK